MTTHLSNHTRQNSVLTMDESECHRPGPSLSAVPDQSSFYTPLTMSNSFRLLKFEKALFDGRTPTSLTFSLDQYDLDDCPAFIAISYVWGKPYRSLDATTIEPETVRFDRSVTIDGAPFLVSANMWDALSAALSHGVTAYLWLDGCCINQADLNERAAQVLLMGRIFASAALVVGFLGPMHPDLDSFYWFLTDFMPRISARIMQGDTSIEKESLWVLRDRVAADKRHFEASLVGAFRFYYSCKWFQRAWVKQEVVLARKLSLVCGRAGITWDGLQLAGVLFTRSNWTMELLVYRYRNLYGLVKDNYFCDAFHQWRGFMEYRTDPERAKSFEEEVLIPMWKMADLRKLKYAWLFEYVLSMKNARCSDPRDKLFSVYGLAVLHCGVSVEAIAPTYTDSTTQVFTKFMGAFATHMETLDFLVFVEPTDYRINTDLPSWVPDFQSTYLYNGHKVVIGLEAKLFLGIDHIASLHSQVLSVSSTLQFKAIRVDRISDIESVSGGRPGSSSRVLMARLNLCSRMPRPKDGSSRIEALWRTATQDVNQLPNEQIPHRPAPAELATSFSAFVLFSFCEELAEAVNENRFAQVCRKIETLLEGFGPEVQNAELPTLAMIREALLWYAQAGEHLVYETRDPEHENGEEGHDWVLWLKKAVETWTSAVAHAQTSSHRCFRSEGSKLGLANEDIRVGDEIWFAPASSLPLVLRPVNSVGDKKTFRYISIAYLHGMMDGEAFPYNANLIDELKLIVLE